MEFLKDLSLAFVPIFVAMDAVGVLPIYISLVEGTDNQRRKVILSQAVATAGAVGVFFVFLGQGIFHFLGITSSDFMVAGGLILLVFSINDLLFSEKSRRKPTDTVGVVPLGMPLVVGPAVLTALFVQSAAVGFAPTLVALGINLILTYIIFRASSQIVRIIGKGGTQGVSKVANLLLAAIAISIIRKGVLGFLEVLGP